MKPPSDVALELFKKGHEASDKFDYFICSVSGAIFAYSAQNYSPKRMELDWLLLEPISLLLLALSFFFGIKRLATSRSVTHINHTIVDCGDKAVEISEMLKKQDLSSQGRQLLEQERQKFLKSSADLEIKLPSFLAKAIIFQKLRDNFLLLGFATIFLAKVLQPYASGRN